MFQHNNKKTHDIPIRRLPSMRTGITLLWIEGISSSLEERDERIDHLCALNNCHIFRCSNVSKCLKYLKQAKSYEHIVIIMIIDNCSSISNNISRLCQYRQIQSIFIVNLVDDKNNDAGIDPLDYTRNRTDIIGEVFHDYESLSDRLQQLLNEANKFDDDFFTFFNRPEKALQDLHNELGPYIWSQSLIVVERTMSYNSSEAKREMLTECRRCCYNNPYNLAMINEYERTYRPADAIFWYTKPCFLHSLINKALRTGDNLIVHKFRYFIVDLCARLEETALHHIEPFRVYRGSILSRDEVEKLQIGSLVAVNGFFSSSRRLDVAQCFICIDPNTGISPSRRRDDRYQYVLFEVDVDLNKSSDAVLTDVSRQSTVPDENEVLFNLGTTFIITNIKYDDEHYVWHINLTASSEVASLSREYNAYILDRCTKTTSAISFGHITCEMFSDYSTTLKYLHRLLRSKTLNDNDYPDIYYYLGRVYRHMEKYDQAITWCQRTQLLLQNRSLELSMTHAHTLACLGTIYSKLGDLQLSMDFHQQATAVYRKILPQNHYEFDFHSNRIAYIYWQRGEYKSAFDLLIDTLSLIKKTLPTHYPGQAQTLHIMGLVQHSLNNNEQALDYFKQSLEMRESFQAVDHPYVARTCYELSILYEEQRNYTIALDYAQRSLHIRKIKLPHNHTELKQSMELVERLSLRNNTFSAIQ